MMIELNLPKYNPRLSKTTTGVMIYDDLRRKAVRLTPEEWVRQHFIHYLIDHLDYPAALTTKRCDTLLYDRQLRPQMILEYKAPHIPLTDKVLQQILRYNLVLRVPYLVLSNGLEHFAYRIDYEGMSYEALPEIPPYARL